MTIALLIAALVMGSIYYFAFTRMGAAELSVRDRTFLKELFEQDSSIINGDACDILFVRGAIKGKSFERDYSPDEDAFGSSYTGYLPDDLLTVLRKKHPQIASPSHVIRFLEGKRTYRWISIVTFDSDDRVIVDVGRYGDKTGLSCMTYEMVKVDGIWTSRMLSCRMS